MISTKRLIFVTLGVTSIGFHIYLIFAGLITNLVARPIHVMLAMPWVFLFGSKSLKETIFGMLFMLAGILCCLYIVLLEASLSEQYGALEGTGQLILAILLIAIILEMARQSVGWPLPLVTLIALLYGMFGYMIPGEFGHPGIPINSFLGNLIIAETGLWGSLTNVSVTIVSIFVIFGCFLNAGEAGEGFMNIAKFFAGKLKGGAAKVSIISSALFGSISGSASANVASTGSITLPTMKKLGYPKKLAASVEAVASSGGQIMPPLMGAGAFVMVELTGIPYDEIIVAAFLPALLFFFTVWIGINFYSGILVLACLHTSCSLTINENADPNVLKLSLIHI